MAVPHLQIQTPCLNQYLPFKIPNSPLAPTLLNVNDIQQTYYLSRGGGKKGGIWYERVINFSIKAKLRFNHQIK